MEKVVSNMTVMEEQQCSEFMLSTISVTFEINLKDFLADIN